MFLKDTRSIVRSDDKILLWSGRSAFALNNSCDAAVWCWRAQRKQTSTPFKIVAKVSRRVRAGRAVPYFSRCTAHAIESVKLTSKDKTLVQHEACSFLDAVTVSVESCIPRRMTTRVKESFSVGIFRSSVPANTSCARCLHCWKLCAI